MRIFGKFPGLNLATLTPPAWLAAVIEAKRVLIVSAVFAGVMATSLYVGVGLKAPSPPPPQDSLATEWASGGQAGKVVFRLADGAHCRSMRFDNGSGAMTSSKTELCEDVREFYEKRGERRSTFRWGQ
ncbi:MAG: hypothetical protein HY056_06260 [Proteobacteria bacterium]|nr:hypothetical protein [Pseudomonadota bacterium]